MVTAVLPCDPLRAYELVSDVVATARHSAEVVSLTWDHRAAPPKICIGDRFTAHNAGMGMTWTSTSVVTAAEPGHVFAFAVGGTEHPTATWTFLLLPDESSGGTLVSYTVELGDGPSMFDAVSGADPARRVVVVERRLDGLATGMRSLLSALST